MYIKKSIELNGQDLTIETGKLAKQAHGSALVRYGDTMVLVTVVANDEMTEQRDFMPLTVEYREKMFAAGKIPGGFIKREGRPSEKEILSARLIDRPIRPLFPDNFFYETQIIASVLSMDRENEPDVLAGIGASAALVFSDIPFEGPIATVRVCKLDDSYVINPTIDQIENSQLELVVAGSEESIMMVEGEGKEVPEDFILEAITHAHEAIKKIIALQKEIAAELNVVKREVPELEFPEGLEEKVTELAVERVKEAIRIGEKIERQKALKAIKEEIIEQLQEEYPESERLIATVLHDLEKQLMREMVLNEQRRLDGRGYVDIRPISCEVDLLPRTHGSALFTRGQTQALGVVTLGTKSDEQIVEALEGESSKRYLLHYNFPPFSTGEAKPIRGVSRREVGHGNLAERALKPVIPEAEEFPYTIRVVSEVLESNGSSSMATVCAGSMALMAAGVPIKSAVAGIAMGLIKEDDKIAILSDILGDEDHLGDMDFKVAGTSKGVTAVQMDIKIGGISQEIMARALQQAREGRMHIMEKMNEAIDKPRDEISPWAPKIIEFHVPVDKIGLIIGPGGKTIRGIIEDAGSEIDINIDEDGKVTVASPDMEAAYKAQRIIESMTEEPVLGKAYRGIVKRVKDFGCFVEFLPGREGMVHISELDVQRTNKVTDVVKEGDEIDVVITRIEPNGKIALSRKAFLRRKLKTGRPTYKKGI
ncbi:Polyribonucleotide nucleotidyltransferase [Caldithrix abyssi DSM 13497]|uniref:Polyribonucleotide nucleotidyltransferase n=1 Tax=Caldithrix abyssi DSM 13497 TaxID=880073 RepID=H1XXM3_CALAY|nr:polyribonucleotide nucleotidyltransferase [Caldithrix abyssi]APF19236.1 pnp polyribonucleotide nucleotidyltransferase [Caldithrix abyssi DSM 13497]EHO43147.1 Polyribonucleotide nucleotidyltransferase [Caldithrix abyssi DSM 13497]